MKCYRAEDFILCITKIQDTFQIADCFAKTACGEERKSYLSEGHVGIKLLHLDLVKIQV